MLRAIAVAKKKNDRTDARKIADCLRCDFLPECHMASTEIRNRRRILRYSGLVLRQAVQIKNRVSGLLMETVCFIGSIEFLPTAEYRQGINRPESRALRSTVRRSGARRSGVSSKRTGDGDLTSQSATAARCYTHCLWASLFVSSDCGTGC
jgi:hypothetical protein